MANVKISDLPAAASASAGQEFEVNESGTSKKVTGAQIATYVEGVVSSDPTFTGQVSLADGSNTAPALTNTGDTNTGIYFPASDELAIATGGTKRFSVDANGITNVDELKVAGNSFPTVGPLSGFRNAIINGNFDIWQRGTSGSSGYVADRWTTLLVGSSAAISRQAFTLGQTDVPNEPEYFHRVVLTSVAGSGNLCTTVQRIEDVRTLAGQTGTISFWAKADASKNIAVEFAQSFGTGGTPSGGVSTGGQTCALTTSWQKFTLQFSIPSISSKTLGTDGNDNLELYFWFDAGSDYNARTNSLGQQSGTFDIAQVQLEAGSVATPFERRPVGTELALCQRYYQAGSINDGGGIGVKYSDPGATRFNSAHTFMVEMRAQPTVSLSTPTYNNCTSIEVGSFSETGFASRVTVSATGTYRAFGATWTADAEI